MVDHGYYVRSVEKHAQLTEIVKKFDLYAQFKSFSLSIGIMKGMRSRRSSIAGTRENTVINIIFPTISKWQSQGVNPISSNTIWRMMRGIYASHIDLENSLDIQYKT